MPSSKTSSIPEDSVLLCDKPAGVTSHDVVASVRRELGAAAGRRRRGPKVGHAGTLDPFATGLLTVLVGRATRLQRYITTRPKTYLATARLGARSSTGDPDGDLTRTGRFPKDLELPTGVVEQQVPMTSAVRVDGERLYARAHRGETVATPVRQVHVHSVRLIDVERTGEGVPVRARYEITCSAGTYVRTLIETLEDAYCEELRRISVGSLTVEPGSRRAVSAAEAVDHLDSRELTDDEVETVRHGGPVEHGEIVPGRRDVGAPGGVETGPEMAPSEVRLLHAGQLKAIAKLVGQRLEPTVVLL